MFPESSSHFFPKSILISWNLITTLFLRATGESFTSENPLSIATAADSILHCTLINVQSNSRRVRDPIFPSFSKSPTINLEICSEILQNRSKTIVPKLRTNHCTMVITQLSRDATNIVSFLQNINGILWRFDKDYFIFHSRNKTELITFLAKELVVNRMKNKLGVLMSAENIREIFAPCPYCGPKGTSKITKLQTIPQNFNLLFPDYLNNFNGKVFSISISSRATDMNEIRQISPGIWKPYRGLFTWAYLHLSERLNFSGTFFPSTGGGGTGLKLPNGTWNGIVGDLLYKKADFGYGIGQVYSRSLVIDVTFPVTYTRLLFVTGIPQPRYSWKAIYLPLDTQVWGWVVSSSAITLLAFVGIMKIVIKMGRNGYLRFPWLLEKAITYLFTTILEQSKRELDLSHAVRTISAFWLIFGILVTTAYRSKLVGLISFPEMEQPPKTFKQLGRSTVGEYDINLHFFGGAAFEIFKSGASPEFKTISKRMHLEKDATKCFQKVQGTVHKVCIAWESVGTHVCNRNFTNRFGYSSVVKAPDSSSFIVISFGVPKMAIFKEKFDRVISVAVAFGLTEKWMDLDRDFVLGERRKWENRESIEGMMEGERDDVGIEALRMEHLKGTFYLFGIANFLAILVYLKEFLDGGVY